MKYHSEITPEERAELEAAGRKTAMEQTEVYATPDGLWGGCIFTDGLGSLGAGSYKDGPASIKQAAYDAAIEERIASGEFGGGEN